VPLALVVRVTLVVACAGIASPSRARAADGERPGTAVNPPQARIFLLGSRQRGTPARFPMRVSDPSSGSYRRFLSLRGYRQRFAPNRADRRHVRRYLAARRGVRRLEASADRSLLLVVTGARAGRRIFCASGAPPPTRGLCIPRPPRGRVRQISAGELFEVGVGPSRASAAPAAQSCDDAVGTGAFTPGQLSGAYEVDPLHARPRRLRDSRRHAELAGDRPRGLPDLGALFRPARTDGAPGRDAGRDSRRRKGARRDGARR
jgi:hypothetical protein